MTTLMSTHSLQMTAGHLPLFDHIESRHSQQAIAWA